MNRTHIRIVFLLILALLSYCHPVSRQPASRPSSTMRWVTVSPSVNIRECPAVSCRVLGAVDYHTQVEVLQFDAKTDNVNGLQGPWAKVQSPSDPAVQGWIFSPLLSENRVAHLTPALVVGLHRPSTESQCNDALTFSEDGTFIAYVNIVTVLDCGNGPCPKGPWCEMKTLSGKWSIAFGRLCLNFSDHAGNPTLQCHQSGEPFHFTDPGAPAGSPSFVVK